MLSMLKKSDKDKIIIKSKKITDEDIEYLTNNYDDLNIKKTVNKSEKKINVSKSSKSINYEKNKSADKLFIEITKKYKDKEETVTIWDDSEFKPFTTLTSNNRGNVGEDYINELCSMCNIKGEICGSSFKGLGKDGDIKEKSIEIKTAYLGNSGTFQHELGEEPWISEYMIFIDVSPKIIYLTIFKNFDEKKYKSKDSLTPYFPTKSITWRKNKGAFKLDTSEKINEECVKKGYCIKINSKTNNEELKFFLNKSIE